MTISRDIKIGIAREAIWGDGDAPLRLLPIDPPSITEPYEQILDNLLRGINAVDFGAYQGSGHVEMGLSGLFYPEELGYFILAMMGNDSPSGTAAPYTHEFTMTSQPPSLSIQEKGGVYEDGATDRRFIGMLPSSLTFTFTASEGLLTWSSDLAGQLGTSAGTAPTWEDTEVNAPFLGWQAALTIGTAAVLNTKLIDCELTLEREAAIRHALDGSQFPSAIYSGGLAVTLSMTFDAVDSTELAYVLGHATDKVEITLTSGADIVVFTMTQLNWGDAPAELDKSGVFITLGISGRAIYNTIDSGPIKITLTNSLANYTN